MNNSEQMRPACDLNERSIRAALPGQVLRDSIVRGLQLRVTANRKVFYLYYRTKTRIERRPKLGDYGAITLTQARKAAQELLAMVAVGKDPVAEFRAQRDEWTMTDLWQKYWKRHDSKKKSSDEDQRVWDKVFEPRFGKKKISEVTFECVCDMMDELADAPIQANRKLALLSKMFNFAKQQLRWDVENPCKGVKRYPEKKRRRYMTAEEATKITQLLDASAKHSPASVAFIYLLMLTGARSGEIAEARWEYLDGNVLRLPDSKTGARPVYLPQAACEIINSLPRTSGTITGIKSPKKLWDRIRKEAGTPDLRLHDLRHSFASFALGAGYSLAQIGELLGHSNTQTTQRYAHLMEEAAARAAQDTADRLMDQIKRTQ